MRITLNLDDDAHELLRRYAESRSITMGDAASSLLRRGWESLQTTVENSVHAVLLSSKSLKITSARIKQPLEDEI